jgi:hypothetical protein
MRKTLCWLITSGFALSGCNAPKSDIRSIDAEASNDLSISQDGASAAPVDAGGSLDTSAVLDGRSEADGTALEDAGYVDHGEFPLDAASMDASVPPLAWGWTWADCRLAYLEGALSEPDHALCDQNFHRVAERSGYGLHWIFLGHDQQTVDTYPETQLNDLNAVYAPSAISFANISRYSIVNPVITEGGRGTTQFTFRDAVPDIRQHLGMESDDPEEVLQAFLERQRSVGAIGDGGRLMERSITLDTRWNSATYYKHIARLYPDLITVIVRDARGEKSTGSYPSRNFSGPTADVVFLTEAGAMSALPHEIGHFFGLVHTHGVWDRMVGATQAWRLTLLNGITDDDWHNLRAVAGDDYASDFSNTYLPYDATEEALSAFESAQIAGRKVLGWGELTYTDVFESVGSDQAFMALVQAGTPPLMKNFVRANEAGSFSGNNCGKSYIGDDRRTLKCKFGDGDNGPEHVITADDLLVRDVLLFGDSTESNLMSYISTYIDDGVRRKIHLTARQRQLLRFGAAMPSRQRLRNFALD